ncbi:hypothetical protein SAMN04488003_11531 [Loktanella fryxellensis]|uniref:Outer membrane protein n=1 Tax=Loktanella fryxellensis TaxID=245187 RepID=A0A1H8G831_9RHOB|nr:lipid A-modifier LpxR family protein [Loktanella fryxellensis]SEN39895.1 hypothetical protein SAMN04488003_11531 [Loktanella fryxellensis]
MLRPAAILLLLLTLAGGGAAVAQDRVAIGNGRLFTNDALGDGHDRWRTGSFVFSHLRSARPWDGRPQQPGQILEYRFRTEIIAPGNGDRDRPYAGTASAGLHTHYGAGPLRYNLGLDLLAIGPQTGIARFQEAFHDAIGLQRPRTEDPLTDRFAAQFTVEARRAVPLSPGATLHPFAEGLVGAEDLLRIGADLVLGAGARDTTLMLRDVATGQLYPGADTDAAAGLTWRLGADVAMVGNSIYLPRDQGYVASDPRARARLGVTWRARSGLAVTYAATWLGPEFEGQPEGQVTGSVQIALRF